MLRGCRENLSRSRTFSKHCLKNANSPETPKIATTTRRTWKDAIKIHRSSMLRLSFSSFFLLLVLVLEPAAPCTTVMVKARDGCTVVGRTMELGIPEAKSELETIHLHPRGTPVGTAHGRHNASAYGFLAVQLTIGSLSPILATTEGINEAGLTVSAQTHVLASYEPGAPNATSPKPTTLFAVQATAFLLGCCKTVDEAAKALSGVRVIATPIIGSLGSLHWSIQDASGASRVFEYIDQALRVYDNTDVGVLTNDPGYEWHLGHLNFFADYPSTPHPKHFEPTASSSGPFSSISVEVKGDGTGVTTTTVPQTSTHGLNARGLPASYSPPDRRASSPYLTISHHISPHLPRSHHSSP